MNITSYFRTFFVTAFVLLGLVSSINYVVNPLGAYDTPIIKGVNDAFPAASNYARIHRTETVKRLKPEVLITGTSRAMIGMDPQPEMFDGLRVYNMGLGASTIAEQRQALEFAHAVHPLKQAIITLDIFSFNALQPDRGADAAGRYDPKNLSPLKFYLYKYNTIPTLDTLLASFRHLRYMKQLERRPVYMPNGRLQQHDVLWRININGAASEFSTDKPARDMSETKFTTSYAGDGGETYQHLEAMLDFTRRNNIDVITFISPLHESYVEKQMKPKGRMDFMDEWKSRVQDIIKANALRYGATPYPLWDFRYKNSITMETVPEAGDLETRMRWFRDDNHYTPETGNLILNKILGLTDPENDPYPDFGRRLL